MSGLYILHTCPSCGGTGDQELIGTGLSDRCLQCDGLGECEIWEEDDEPIDEPIANEDDLP